MPYGTDVSQWGGVCSVVGWLLQQQTNDHQWHDNVGHGMTEAPATTPHHPADPSVSSTLSSSCGGGGMVVVVAVAWGPTAPTTDRLDSVSRLPCLPALPYPSTQLPSFSVSVSLSLSPSPIPPLPPHSYKLPRHYPLHHVPVLTDCTPSVLGPVAVATGALFPVSSLGAVLHVLNSECTDVPRLSLARILQWFPFSSSLFVLFPLPL